MTTQIFDKKDYPIYLAMKSRESGEAIALINIEKLDDDRFASREIQDQFAKVYKIEQISEAQFETYELFGVPTTLPMDMTFISLETESTWGRSPSEISKRKVKAGIL